MHAADPTSTPITAPSSRRCASRQQLRAVLAAACALVSAVPLQILPAAASTAGVNDTGSVRVADGLAHSPIVFEVNEGQVDTNAAFVAHNGPSILLLERDRVVLSVAKARQPLAVPRHGRAVPTNALPQPPEV